MARRIFYAVSAFILATAAFIVPLPLVELAPGTSTPVPPLIDLAAETTPVNGSLEMLTIRVREPSLVGAVQAWLSPTRELQQREQVIPPGVEEADFYRIQRQQFERSFRVAVAVGLRAAGHPVEVATRPIVFSVLPGGPADGVLQPGDVLLEAQDTSLASGDDLRAAIRDIEDGERVDLVVERDGERRAVAVTARPIPQLEGPGIGIAIETIGDDVEFPFDVELDERSGIGGPSAGLMFALAVYDLLSEEDLAAGRSIAGTGTLDAEGNVGPIGGIEEKVAAAELADVDIMLAPAALGDAAKGAVTGDLVVIPVATLDEAIAALRDGATSGPAEDP